MAPVESDYVPASIVPVKNLRAVDKALELPLVNSAYSEVTRIASPLTPYVESTLTKMTPMVEAGYQTRHSQRYGANDQSRECPPTVCSPLEGSRYPSSRGWLQQAAIRRERLQGLQQMK